MLETTAAAPYFPGGIPFVFTVNAAGHYVARFEHDAAERRRDTKTDPYRGYDRRNMLAQLTTMRDAARRP